MAMQQMGKALDKLSRQTPASPKDIELWAYAHHNVRLGEETIRKAHRGQVDPMTCSFDLLIGLVAFYGIEPEALGHVAANRIHSVLAMAGDPPAAPHGGLLVMPSDTPAEQGEPPTIWKTNVVALRPSKVHVEDQAA